MGINSVSSRQLRIHQSRKARGRFLAAQHLSWLSFPPPSRRSPAGPVEPHWTRLPPESSKPLQRTPACANGGSESASKLLNWTGPRNPTAGLDTALRAGADESRGLNASHLGSRPPECDLGQCVILNSPLPRCSHCSVRASVDGCFVRHPLRVQRSLARVMTAIWPGLTSPTPRPLTRPSSSSISISNRICASGKTLPNPGHAPCTRNCSDA